MPSTDGESICSIQVAAGKMDLELAGCTLSPGALQVHDETPCSLPASPSGHHLSRVKVDHTSKPSLLIRGGGEGPVVPRRSDGIREWDWQFDHFRTFCSHREWQLSGLHGLVPHEKPAAHIEHGTVSKIFEADTNEGDNVPSADRYFDALEGPELETLHSTEFAMLPEDERWPFLLRFPISMFGMCLGLSRHAMLWKTLSAFLHVHPAANHILWWLSVALTVITYLLKVVFYFDAVCREFHHPFHVNFFFAPCITWLFLIKCLPCPNWKIHQAVWYLLMAPILCLDLKIYGQWMSSGDRRLSKVANPLNHLAVVGNFISGELGSRMGLQELPIFFFAIGLAHYIMLFVTLYQRLPTNAQLPKELHPVFFLFVAAPSNASIAWATISNEVKHCAKLLYFLSVFLYGSLMVRLNLFKGIRFSLAWWAYTFPMTSIALATVLYASKVNNMLTQALVVGLAGLTTLTVIGVLASTVYHAFVLGDIFPNDVSIAIIRRKPSSARSSRTSAHPAPGPV